MSVTKSPPTSAAAWIERTWRATIECPYSPVEGALYSLTVHREVVGIDADSNLVEQPTGIQPVDFTVKFVDIKDETVTVGGTTLTVAQLSAFLRAYFDQKAVALGA